jgi:hypothetical protein
MFRFMIYLCFATFLLTMNLHAQQCNKKQDPFCEDTIVEPQQKPVKDMEVDQEIQPIPSQVPDQVEISTDECSVKNLALCEYLYFYEQPNEIRYLMFIGLFLLSYLFPLLFYSILLRNPNYTPGSAAAICLLFGGLLIAIPGSSLLLARNVIDLGGTNLLVPFYLQTGNYIWIALFVSFFMILSIISSQSKVRN